MKHDEPKSAREILIVDQDSPKLAYDSWPPSKWFKGIDANDESGIPFDWSAPPTDFSIDDAYRWTDRVHGLYQHFEAVGIRWYSNNGESDSALNNVYLLLKDLRRRSLVPLVGKREYNVHMNDVPPGFEVRELDVQRQWLGKMVTRKRLHDERTRSSGIRNAERAEKVLREALAAQKAQEFEKHRLKADLINNTVSFENTVYQVGELPARFIHVLLLAKDWMYLNEIKIEIKKLLKGIEISHTERIKEKLPDCIQELIEVSNRGHRIKQGHRTTLS